MQENSSFDFVSGPAFRWQTLCPGRYHMRLQIVLTLFLLISAGLAHAQASKGPSSAGALSKFESEIKETMRQRLDAVERGDVKTYLSYFGDDCIVTSDTGALIKPDAIVKEWADNLHSGIKFKGSELLDFQVHSYGDIAVASFRRDLDEDWAGQKLFGASRFADVFARREGRWLLVAHHETPIPNARRVAVKVNATVFDAYTGEYQLTPNQIVMVKREGDKLMDQWPGDAGFSEDVPVSESTFVPRGGEGEVIYMKDENGKVTQFILRLDKGDLIAKKIK
jgi:ketosteroid isomerase-like protein